MTEENISAGIVKVKLAGFRSLRLRIEFLSKPLPRACEVGACKKVPSLNDIWTSSSSDVKKSLVVQRVCIEAIVWVWCVKGHRGSR